MSILEKEIMTANENCARCLDKCKGCQCKNVKKVMNSAAKMERDGMLTKTDKEAYMAFMRG
jgi:hypothetical protein